MSTPATVAWSDVINNFMEAVKHVLYEIGSFIVNNATAIADALIGIGLAYGIARMAVRLPFIREIIGRIF